VIRPITWGDLICVRPFAQLPLFLLPQYQPQGDGTCLNFSDYNLRSSVEVVQQVVPTISLSRVSCGQTNYFEIRGPENFINRVYEIVKL